jgi:2OG-Fe(II) oxygenase superfamily
MQAGIRVPWEKEHQGDLIAAVMRRVYNYTNHATGFGLEVEGQEDIMSIQYFGRGEGDKAPDQYRPHCDGDCNSLPHKRGGRVATMVMYCDTTDLIGGGTNFGKAGVFVKPKVGAAAFFSYLDPETHIHEPGFTSHSGCPVVEGRKRIAVHWMRIGVDKENPWTSFDTNNIKKSECDEYD